MLKKVSLLIITFLMPYWSSAQCAMCRAALQSEESGIKAEGINNGIKYLMVIPYVLAAITGVMIYRMYKKKQG
ncbi:MAG: hypothetical protein H6584_03700 [Flavobacteriales bacterium]|nr:hypothetical protein [Flavobacteriales bacterium]